MSEITTIISLMPHAFWLNHQSREKSKQLETLGPSHN